MQIISGKIKISLHHAISSFDGIENGGDWLRPFKELNTIAEQS